jgi:hypothetical protein
MIWFGLNCAAARHRGPIPKTKAISLGERRFEIRSDTMVALSISISNQMMARGTARHSSVSLPAHIQSFSHILIAKRIPSHTNSLLPCIR